MGYSISLAISVNKLTNDSIQIVLVIIFCGELAVGCTGFIFPNVAICWYIAGIKK